MESEMDAAFEVVSHRLAGDGVDFLMIGGHAVNHYGVSRATQDIDFMIASEDEAAVRRIMRGAGFSNEASHETVLFFNRPGSPIRIDFLKVDRDTLDTLLAGSQRIEYFRGYTLRVPRLLDLLAMKIFALSQGGARREDKDLGDIINLTIHHKLPIEKVRELCERFASEPVRALIEQRLTSTRE